MKPNAAPASTPAAAHDGSFANDGHASNIWGLRAEGRAGCQTRACRALTEKASTPGDSVRQRIAKRYNRKNSKDDREFKRSARENFRAYIFEGQPHAQRA